MNERMPISRIGAVALDRKVGETEQQLRHELAAVFRIAHHLGWNVDTLNHISLRIPGTETFLMNPQGLGWDEITASSLSTLDYKWNVLSHAGIKPQPAGYNFHSGILEARPDVNCVHARARDRRHSDRLDRRGRAAGHRLPGRLPALPGGRLPRLRGPGAGGGRGAAHARRPRHRQARPDHAQPRHAQHRRDARRGVRLHARADRRLRAADADHGDRPQAPIPRAAGPHQGADEQPAAPREDISWHYWLRLAERLDPSFADKAHHDLEQRRPPARRSSRVIADGE